MTSSEFNIRKEQEQSKINEMIQSVKASQMEESSKQTFIEIGTKIINAINLQRTFVYAELENFSFDQTYNHDEALAKKVYEGDLTSITHQINNDLTVIEKNVLLVDAVKLTGPENNKISKELDEFNDFNKNIIRMIGDLREVAGSAKQEAFIQAENLNVTTVEENLDVETSNVETPNVEDFMPISEVEDFDSLTEEPTQDEDSKEEEI